MLKLTVSGLLNAYIAYGKLMTGLLIQSFAKFVYVLYDRNVHGCDEAILWCVVLYRYHTAEIPFKNLINKKFLIIYI